MKLWLVRHAPVLLAPGRCYGASNIPVDPVLTRQAAARFAPVPAQDSVLFSSPLDRTHLLALELLRLRPDFQEIHLDARLQEMDFGTWELQPWEDIPKSAFDAWTSDFSNHRFGGVESTQTVIDRVADALNDLCARGHRDVVWVTHAGVIKAVTFLFKGRGRSIHATADWPASAPAMGAWTMFDLDGATRL